MAEAFERRRERVWLTNVPVGEGAPEVVNVVIEIPRGSRNKYEVDKQTGFIRLDRYLYSASHYPGDYGFIPRTHAEDGDALDVLVMVNEPTFSGCLIEARVIGLFKMTDGGDPDYKVLGVPNTDPLFAEINRLRDVPTHYLREVEHFFATYKQLEGKDVTTEGWVGKDEALQAIRDAMGAYAPGKASSEV